MILELLQDVTNAQERHFFTEKCVSRERKTIYLKRSNKLYVFIILTWRHLNLAVFHIFYEDLRVTVTY